MGPEIRKITVFIGALMLALSCSSCQAAEKSDITSKDSVINSAPQTAPDKTAAEKLVYLKVEKAAASGFDESPDWAPKPDPMAPVDGDMETRWSSGYRDNEWIYFDFGKPKTVSKFIVRWESAYAPRYEIQVSDDAQTWETVKLMEGQTGGVNEIQIEPVACRYIKLLALSRANEEWGVSIWEFESYGPASMNPGDVSIEDTFKGRKDKSVIEMKRSQLSIAPGEIVPSPGPITTAEFHRGVNYTSWNPDELGGETSDTSLIYLSEIGVGHVALMTVWYQDDAGSKVIYQDPEKSVSDESVGHAINIMHKLGMKVMLKPHVDLADEEARSNIIPSDDWFASYKKFIVHYATLAAKYNAELLCIGTELSNTTIVTYKAKWLDIINEIRSVYKGPITYAANWDEYDTVSFWPEVDYIGMDAYFPLTKNSNPTLEELIAGWKNNADVIEKWLKDSNLTKPVIFTEVGYDTIEGSNKQPWRILPTLAQYKESQDEQANCLLALFTVLKDRTWFKGFYWWNYFPRPDLGPLGYTLRGKKGEKILTEWFNKLK